jgi:DNA replication and repair protein RecF
MAEDGPHELTVGFTPGEPKRMRVDGAVVDRLLDVESRPLVSVFLPDRLELIKGPPSLRRAHLDQFVGALWPARTATRRAFAQSLAQRNALLLRLRTGRGSADSLLSWDRQFATRGLALMRDREHAVEVIQDSFAALAASLGLDGNVTISYRPRSRATEPDQLVSELAERLQSDVERGFTGHGPHRDELAMLLEDRDLRAFGSQGQQRLGLLALLLAEREAITQTRGATPLLLLDDVMSELDHHRRQALVDLVRTGSGQSVITTTDLEHVPGAADEDVTRVAVTGHVLAHVELAHESISP